MASRNLCVLPTVLSAIILLSHIGLQRRLTSSRPVDVGLGDVRRCDQSHLTTASAAILGHQVGQVGLDQRGLLRMRALLRPALLLLNDELFLAFGGLEGLRGAGHNVHLIRCDLQYASSIRAIVDIISAAVITRVWVLYPTAHLYVVAAVLTLIIAAARAHEARGSFGRSRRFCQHRLLRLRLDEGP